MQVEHDKPPDAEGDPSMNEVKVVVVIVVVIVVMEGKSDAMGAALEPSKSVIVVATTLSTIPELSSFLESSTLTPFSTPLKIFLALIHPL
jgi:hypothetical protein